MRPTSHFETSTNPVLGVSGQLIALISDMRRTVHNFDINIEEEEFRVQVFDVAKATYPILARSLRSRRDNLLATISALETYLNNALRVLADDRVA